MGDGFAPFTAPYMKALQMKAFVDDIAFKKEVRERQREQWAMEMEQNKRRNAFEDFKTTLELHQMGGLPVESGVVGDFRSAMGGRSAMTTPVGSYSIPTPEQQAERAGRAKGAGQVAYESVYDPNEEVNLGPEMGGAKVKVPRSKAADVIIKAYEKTHPNLHITTSTDDAGNLKILGTNPNTGDVKELKTITGAGKSYHPPAGQESIEGFDTEIKTRMDEWRKGWYHQLGITPQMEAAARGDAAYLPEEQKDASARIRQAEDDLYKRALDSVKNQGKGQKKQQAAGASKPLAGKAIRRANIAAAAKLKGMTPQAFEQQWAAGGGIINP